MARRIETLFVRYRRRGDAAALGRVFDQAAPEILRVAMHFARHPAEAEDLLQETFLTVIARAESYDADRPLVPWLIGILRNHARRLRRVRARREATADLPDSPAVDESWMDVAWTESVAAAVEALPDPYRQALVLKLRHDKSPAEIAVLLDLPPATVRSQIHRGLDRLRRHLPPDGRPRALVALPIGVGLTGVREQVLARASEVAAGTVAATTVLPFLTLAGGLLMTKKTGIAVGVLLAALGIGAGAWLGGVFDGADDDGPSERLIVDRAPPDAAPAPAPPTLVGTGAPSEAPPTPVPAPVEAPPEPVWPPQLEIPADKGSVAGTIRFEDGTPVVGVTVALWGSPSIPAVTDEQGRFHIHADWVHTRSLFVRLGRADQPDYLGLILSTEVAMRNGELVERDLTIKRGIVLEAAVVDAHSGEPVPDANVVLRRQPLSGGQGSSGFLRTDVQGRFRFPYVPRGVYTLELKRDGYEGSVAEYDLTLDCLPPELKIVASRPLVIRFENLPAGAIGTVVSCDLSRMDDTAFSVNKRVKVTREGTLLLDAPEPGTYRLTLWKSSHLPKLEREVVIPDGPLEPILWALDRGASVVGTIRDAEGEPIADVRVSIGKAAGRPSTDAEGAFAFTYVSAGRRSVKVLVGTAWVDFGTVEVPASGTARFDLRAPGSSEVRGKLFVAGKPMDVYSGGLIVREASTKREVAQARPDAKGEFRVPHLAAGVYQLYAWSGNAAPKGVTAELRRGERKGVGTIDLAGHLPIPVRFVLPAGRDVPHLLHVQAFDGSQPAHVRKPLLTKVWGTVSGVSPYLHRDAGGKAWVSGVPAGPVRLVFLAEGFEEAVLEVDVRPGMTEPLVVRLEPK